MIFRLVPNPDNASTYREFEAEEKFVFESLAKRVPLLEAELVLAIDLDHHNVDMLVQARQKMTQQGEAFNEVVQKLMEDLKKMMASNLDLTRQVGNLQIELALAHKAALIVLKESLIAKAGQFVVPSDA